jgi:ligand-binding sensor domain-containing protein
MRTELHTAIALTMCMTPALAGATEWMHFDATGEQLPHNAINALESTDAGIWIGSEGGLTHFDGTIWRTYTQGDFLPANKVNDVHMDATGTLWVATYEGMAVYRNRMWEVMTSENSMLPTNLVRSLSSDADGDLWAGTWGNGLVRMGHGTSEVFTAENSALPSNGIYCVKVDAQGRVWAGTHGGGVAFLENGHWTVFNTANSGLPHNNVLSIGFGADGEVWMGTHNGLVRLTLDGEVPWQVFNSIYFDHDVQVFKDIVADDNGVLWFATDGGLLELRDGVFEFMSESNSGLASDYCNAVAVDANGNVYAGHAHLGLSIFNSNGIALNVRPEKTQLNMEVFPNPTTDVIQVRVPLKGDGQHEISVTDLAGRAVIRSASMSSSDGETVRHTVDVSTLPVGVYVVTVRADQEIASAPFMKR